MASAVLMVSAPHKSRSSPVRERGSGDDSEQLQQQLQQLDQQARAAALRGDVAESARLILLAMDCERRLASRGPQILQLIKPRA